MRRFFASWLGTLVVCSMTIAVALAQRDSLQGRWEGMVRAPQGERPARVTFKKEGDTYSGTLSGISGTTELPLKEIKLDGDKVNAKLQVDTPQGPVVVNFDFVLSGETLQGKGEVNVGGQSFTFAYDMKRVGDLVSQPQLTPVQKLDYFVGQWKFEMTGRESPLGPGGNLEGSMTFERALEGKFLQSRFEGKSDDTKVQGGAYIGYDAENKVYTFFEYQGNGIGLLSTATWIGPAIRIETVPVNIQGQTIRLRRLISVISDSSFTIKEEFSVDGGPFQRLGNGTFSKVTAAVQK